MVRSMLRKRGMHSQGISIDPTITSNNNNFMAEKTFCKNIKGRRKLPVLVLAILAFLFFIVPILYTLHHNLTKITNKDNIQLLSDNTSHWTILLTVTDGYYDFFLNWLAYYTRLSPALNLTVIVIAEDDVVFHKLQQLQQGGGQGGSLHRGIALPNSFRIERSQLELMTPIRSDIKQHANDAATTSKETTKNGSSPVALTYETPKYNQLVSTRASQILDKLERGLNILYSDVDTVWLSNPLFWINNARYENMDFVAQSDGIRHFNTWYCTGFMAIRSNKRSIRLMRDWKLALQTPQLNQPIFNEIVQKATRHYQLRHAALPLESFPHGEMYFSENFDKRAEVAVVHNNYVVGHGVKKERFKKHLLWLLNEDGDGDNTIDPTIASNQPKSFPEMHKPGFWHNLLNPSTRSTKKHTPTVPVATLATTLHLADPGTQKYYIQLNTLRALALLSNDINVVVFTKNDTHVEQLCQQLGIHVIKEYETNPHGTPFLRSLFQILESNYSKSSTFIGYVNGDIIFDSRLIHTLWAIRQAHLNGVLYRHQLLMVGRRTNVNMSASLGENHTDMVQEDQNLDQFVDRMHSRGELMAADAEDFFIITPGIFNWEEIPDFVIGRPGYDNWLVDYVYHRQNENCSLIDLTETAIAIHQTGFDGDKAGFQVRNDTKWNNRPWNELSHGFTTCAPLKTVWDSTKERVLLEWRHGRIC